MAITPEELLTCVESMTDEQRARFCELVDPAHDDDIETEVEEIMTRVERVMGPARTAMMEQGIQGPPLGEGEYVESFDGYQRGAVPSSTFRVPMPVQVRKPVPQGLFRPPSPETVAALLYIQLTGKKFDLEAARAVMEADAVQPLDDSSAIAARDAEYLSRWSRATIRWKEAFNEVQIPMIRRPQDGGADLDLIETLLYDKEVKGMDPKRCPCGCTYVVGCGNFSDYRNMEE